MSVKGMVIVSEQLGHNIDRHRGKLSRAEFVDVAVKKVLSHLETSDERRHAALVEEHAQPKMPNEAIEQVTRLEFEQWKRDMIKLQQEFKDFFIKYGGWLTGQAVSEEDSGRFRSELRRLLAL